MVLLNCIHFGGVNMNYWFQVNRPDTSMCVMCGSNKEGFCTKMKRWCHIVAGLPKKNTCDIMKMSK